MTFNLAGLTPGSYSLRVTDESGANDTEAIQLVAGVGVDLGGTIEGPRSVRPNREYLFYVNYGNNGDADAVAPLFLVENLGTNPLALDRADLGSQAVPAGKVIQVMGTSPEAPQAYCDLGNWAACQCSSIRPAAPAGTACIRSGRPTLGRSTLLNLKSRCGPTRCPTRSGTRCARGWSSAWGQRLAATCSGRVATELGDLGIRTFNVNQIFEEMVRQAFDPAPIALTGYVVRDPDCEPVADPKLIAVAADECDDAFADAQGAYRFYDLDPGVYTILAQGPGAVASDCVECGRGESPRAEYIASS